MLPEGTCLGDVDLIEIYSYMNDPSIFYAKNSTGQHFLVYWCDYENEQDGWLYLPLSEKRLDQLRRKELSIKKAFEISQQGFYLVYTGNGDDIAVFKTLQTIEKSFLPPHDIFIEYVDVVDEEADNWDFELIIKNISNKLSPTTKVTAKCVEYFQNILFSLASDKYYKTFPFCASHGSFELKLETNKINETFTSLITLKDILNSDTNNIALEAFNNKLDPYLLKSLLELLREYNVSLEIKPKYAHTEFSDIMIKGNIIDHLITALAENSPMVVSSIKVPQANDIYKVIRYVEIKASGNEVTHDLIDGLSSKRQIEYHAHAAAILGLVDKGFNLTPIGQYFVSLEKNSKMQFLADRFETSDIVVAWLKWENCRSFSELTDKNVVEFVNQSVPALSESTSRRRATNLKKWLNDLKPHYRGYQNQEN